MGIMLQSAVTLLLLMALPSPSVSAAAADVRERKEKKRRKEGLSLSSSAVSLTPSKSRSAVVAEKDFKSDQQEVGHHETNWMEQYPSVVEKLQDSKDVDMSWLYEQHKVRQRQRLSRSLWQKSLLASGGVVVTMLLSLVVLPMFGLGSSLDLTSLVALVIPSVWLTDMTSGGGSGKLFVGSFLSELYGFSRLFLSLETRNHIRYSMLPWAYGVLRKRFLMEVWKSVWTLVGKLVTALLKDGLLQEQKQNRFWQSNLIPSWVRTIEAFVERSFRRETIMWARKTVEKTVERCIEATLVAILWKLQYLAFPATQPFLEDKQEKPIEATRPK